MKTTIPLELINIEDEGFHLLFEVQINDKAARVILDTGASRSVFDSNCLDLFIANPALNKEERLSTGVGSSELQSFSICFDSFCLGTLLIENYNVAILDLQHITSSYNKLDIGAVQGVIGGDILEKYNAIIDYNKKTLTLSET